MRKFDAVVVGDVNIDLVVAGHKGVPLPGQEVYVDSIGMHIGGGAALFGVALAKLGMKLALAGVLGKDYYGQYLLDQLAQHNIDTSKIKISRVNGTGISIALHPETDRSFITYAGSNAELGIGQLDLDSIAEGRHVHLTGYKGSANHDAFVHAAERLQARGVTVSLDTGWDDTGEWYKGIMELASITDILFMNETEAIHFTGSASVEEAIRVLSRHGEHVVVKLGSRGAVAAVKGRSVYRPGYRVNALDTTGAGDCFNAGYVYGYLAGKTPEDCLLYGNACGALSVSAYGGSAGAADLETLERFIAQYAADGREVGS
ncbi:carbohydrate kinase [Gordoniibacillus kamchatkensis]|uniref:Carbohydrate kinase n=1 Tax=Gordoniibacillus kamchatkensis TaxID=1590651 RepID=A0ABR5AKQ4_9BACL|nr:carbohydrate kinase family protein [Paenibacillus sp. VKM B-2647]KIL41373.1 carbohydrate kinase [Paenibacillus sp. VKM B-2647]